MSILKKNPAVTVFTSEKDKHLFQRWQQTKDEETANQLIQQYMPLVNIITEKIYKSLPNSFHKDDIKSLALLGLYDALEKYDPERDLKFETYATFRIRGAILDGLRKEDWLPRKTRERAKKVASIVSSLEQKYLRSVTPEEVALEADLPVGEVRHLMDENYLSNILSIDEERNNDDHESQSFVLKDDTIKTPEEELVRSERIQELVQRIKELTEKEQLVLSLLYVEDLSFTEVGQILDLSTSRISQIHSKAIKKLRDLLQE